MDAARDGELGQVQELLDQGQQLNDQADQIAGDYGLEECGSALGSAPVSAAPGSLRGPRPSAAPLHGCGGGCAPCALRAAAALRDGPPVGFERVRDGLGQRG